MTPHRRHRGPHLLGVQGEAGFSEDLRQLVVIESVAITRPPVQVLQHPQPPGDAVRHSVFGVHAVGTSTDRTRPDSRSQSLTPGSIAIRGTGVAAAAMRRAAVHRLTNVPFLDTLCSLTMPMFVMSIVA
jgi:hypothetical protein